MSDAAVKIEGLSPEERLDLLERLWDSLARTPSDVPVTPEQRAELDQRLDGLDRDIQEGGKLGVPWDEVLRQIRGRCGSSSRLPAAPCWYVSFSASVGR